MNINIGDFNIIVRAAPRSVILLPLTRHAEIQTLKHKTFMTHNNIEPH